ncbi:ankyrin repeat domain-containing protein [Exiguobacterium sp. S90]|uniref:ankyrin repeat domain-containing protein n=1 Tax=Exiguobacterium sp. S90 TaxID=1221231 RepID=UPI001BE6A299
MKKKQIISVVLLFLIGIGATTYLLIEQRNQQAFEKSIDTSDVNAFASAVEHVSLSTKDRNQYIQQFQEALDYDKALVLLDDTSVKNQVNWFYVARFGPASVVKQWLAKGASVEQTNEQQQTVLHVATSVNQPADAYALLIKEATRKNINALDKAGNSPLYYATVDQNETVIKQLLTAGANPNVGKHQPIYEAVKQDRQDIYQLLVKQGAEVKKTKVKKLARAYGATTFQ